MYIEFETLPDSARIWVFQSTQNLEYKEVERISAHLMNFLDSWQAHGKDLKASFTILYERFIVISLDEASYQATGCSIDKLMHLIQALEKETGISLLDRMQVAFKSEGLIHTIPMNAFREELSKGEYDQTTVVFNNMIETKGQLKNEWEVQVKDSWHKQLLPIA